MSDPGASGRLGRVLETVLYYDDAVRDEVLRFYDEVLGLRRVSEWDNGTAYRLGDGVLLLFDRERLARSDSPVSQHGTTGPGHVCVVAEPGAYDELRSRLRAAGIAIEHDHEWPSAKRSFYFRDPAANLLEIADSDLWPG